MNLGLKEKTALVLAASKGLGKASALSLAKEGANVIICSRDKKVLQASASEIQQASSGEVVAVVCDVTNLKSLESLVSQSVKKFGKIDILVNNAGGPQAGTFETLKDEEWQKTFDLTLMSAVRTIRLVLPHMKKTGSGRIINMVSISAKQPTKNLILSNSLRAGVLGMAKTIADEFAQYNITVNNICTGYFFTDRLKQLYGIDEKMKDKLIEATAWKDIVKNIPLKRAGRPEEYGELVAFLASEQAAYITGTSIQIDGGLSRSLL